MDIEKIKERINHLLRTASNDASTPNEKAVAMQMANNLMRRYNLDRDDCTDTSNDDNFKTVSVQSRWSRMTPWESQLGVFVINHVVKGAFCVESKVGNNGKSVGRGILQFTGLGADAEMAAATYSFLCDVLISQCVSKHGSPVRDDGRMYAIGFVRGLFLAAREAEKMERDSESISRALIRTDMLKEASKNYFLSQLNGVRLKSGKRSVTGSFNGAYHDGVCDGMNADSSKRRTIVGRLN